MNNINDQVIFSDGSLSADNELHTLIKACIAQSRSAQKKLYDQYSPAAYGIIKRYIYGNEQLAQEVLNDAFFKILTKLDQYSFQGAFEGWVRRIVVNTLMDHVRKNVKYDKLHKEIHPEDAYINSEPVERMSYRELLAIVHTLPDAQRSVFNFFVFENLSHKEIGAALGLTENNSRWYLNDARRRLKEKIKNITNQEGYGL